MGSGSGDDPPSTIHGLIDDRAAPAGERFVDVARAVGERYIVEGLVGEGGHSRVFAARETATGHRVAIKLLRVVDPSPAADPSLRTHRALVAEARSMAQLDHPTLCRVREVSIQGRTPFLVMDWAGGVPLDEAWKRWSLTRRLGLLMRVIEGVAAAHQQGVIHGDLKPANILVRRNGKPVIVDFGLARSERDVVDGEPAAAAGARDGLAGDDDGSPRAHGGTPGYSALEQFQPGAELSPATDVFAIGVLLYLMLTDRTPFPTDLSPAVLFERMTRFDPALPESLRGDTPPELQKICLRALEREPGDRYRDASALAADLRRYLRREPVLARPTVLVRRFEAQVSEQSDTVREWLRLGLISPRDAGSLLTGVRRAARAEHFADDSGRLSLARGGQRVGGLLVAGTLLAGLGVGGLGGAVAWAGLVAFASLLVVGLRLSRTNRDGDAAAALVTSLVSLPIGGIALLRELGLFDDPGAAGMTIRSLLVMVPGRFPP
ncbi:MAG: serine/threonine-protein kinase, partial [Planctomycetota bacterium]